MDLHFRVLLYSSSVMYSMYITEMEDTLSIKQILELFKNSDFEKIRGI